MLIYASPSNKLDIVLIIRNLVQANVSPETFNNALMEPLMEEEKDEAKSLFDSWKSPLVNFLFGYALQLRSESATKGYGLLSVSQELTKLVYEIIMKLDATKGQEQLEDIVLKLNEAQPVI